MKKQVSLLLVLAFIGASTAFAQKKAATPSQLSSKQQMLCHAWACKATEEFGVKKPLPADQQHDGVTFVKDEHTAFIIRHGKTQTGTWKTNKACTYIYITLDGSKKKLMYKLIDVNDNSLTLEYQTPDLVRTTYYYELKK